MKRIMRIVVAAALVFVLAAQPWFGGFSRVLGPSPVLATTGGPVILDGTDAGLHGSVNTGTTPATLNSTWVYLKKAYENLLAGVPGSYTNNGKVAVIGASTSTATSNNCGAASYYIGQQLGITIDFFEGASAIETFFVGVLANTNRYKLIHIVEQNWCGNGMDNTEAAKVDAAGQAIAAHVNRGGALFAQSQSYGWLSDLFPTLSRNSSSGSTPALTTAGNTQFPGLTNSDITAPWHNSFQDSSGTLPLDILALDGGRPVIIGGSSVSLPSAVTATETPSGTAGTGSSVCLVVNVKSGSPLANFSGATVSFSIAGANSGATISNQTTDASGNTPSVCYSGSNAGTDTITASAVNPSNSNSLGEAVVSFIWTAPATTVPASTVAPALVITPDTSTTTTVTSTTVVSVPPTTLVPGRQAFGAGAVVVLPETGANSSGRVELVILALGLMFLGVRRILRADL
jgi:hypothetical protein